MILLFVSVCFFSINNILWSYYAAFNHPLLLISRRAIFTSLFYVFVCYITLGGWVRTTPAEFLKILSICILGFSGLVLLVKGFSKGNIFEYSIYSLLLTYFFTFYQPQLSSKLFFWISLIIISFGFLYFIWSQPSFSKSKGKQLNAHIFFLSAHICFGAATILQFQILKLNHYPSLQIATIQEIGILILANLILHFLIKQNKKNIEKKLRTWHYFVFALPICFAIFFGLEGLKKTSPFDASLIGLYTPIVTVVFGSLFKVTLFDFKSFIGLVTMTIGVLLLYL
jgi:drug/metabolite transporter (DMT)-like permease